ncbi:MAG: glutamine--fructose-6-phosphate transaminase (isomerizing) [Christensenellaceae bacterium]|jgi:glucosamine--fructose-6-phosphate aminotransferase (isomerizing)
MCGIVGYVGGRDVIPVLIGGLKKLEYRGYDSAGVAYLSQNGEMNVYKAKGRLKELEALVDGKNEADTIGIGHTRWATHGEPNFENSHPHTSMQGDVAIVHNGIIENYLKVKEWLTRRGIAFSSDTDTEVIAHLVNFFLEGDLKTAVHKALNMLEGSYAIAVVCRQFPDEVVAAKKDSPLVVGLGEGESLIASDIPALLKYTHDVIFLEDGELAVLRRDKVRLYDKYMNRIVKQPFAVDWDVDQAEKAGYEHFMIKEIEEQPRALTDTLNTRVEDGAICLAEAGLTDQTFKNIEKITIVACGTAYHAAYVGKYLLERYARVKTDVEIASEFRYKKPILGKTDFVIVVSQSGETADTIAALRQAKKQGAYVLAICNVVGSTVAREADSVFYTRAGLEIAVASTKAYTTQLMAMYMLCLNLCRAKAVITEEEYKGSVAELRRVPEKVQDVLQNKVALQKFAAQHFSESSVFYIGRGLDYALAMEGSLKLKEISYIHSEAYAAGELKHGTIALIEPGTLVVAVLTQGELLDKSISNVREVKSRGAIVLAITQQKYVEKVADAVDHLVAVPDTEDFMAPITAMVPMQLFAYYMSVEKGCDVDRPRNLAKSVTVE